MNAANGLGARVLAALLGLALAGPAVAQTNTGTTIGQFLLLEPDARVAGMGNAGCTLYDGVRGTYYNPASIGSVNGLQAVFSHNDWFAGITHDWAAVAIPVGSLGAVYGTVTALNSGDMDVRTVDFPLGTGERFSVNDIAISVGYGRQVSLRFAAGGQVNWAQETIWHTSASTFSFNFGTLYRVSDDGLRIAASLSNFGTRGAYGGRDLRFTYDNVPGQNGDNSTLPAERFTESFAVPVLFRVGAGLPVRLGGQSRLLLAADAFHPNDNSESVSVGAEYSLKNLVAVRAGWQNLFLQDSEVGLTLGAGLRARYQDVQYRFDYAWADEGRLGSSHRLTLAISP